MGALHQVELPLAPAPPERSLEFVVLRALGDPGVVPCPVCGGRTDEIAGGVSCVDCGTEIARDRDDEELDNLILLDAALAD